MATTISTSSGDQFALRREPRFWRTQKGSARWHWSRDGLSASKNRRTRCETYWRDAATGCASRWARCQTTPSHPTTSSRAFGYREVARNRAHRCRPRVRGQAHDVVMAETIRGGLTAGEGALLRRAAPDADRILDRPIEDISSDDLNALREQVGDLLTTHGFDENYDVNALGGQCEDLIDRLAPWHWGKDALR